jgi:hypothetical protein
MNVRKLLREMFAYIAWQEDVLRERVVHYDASSPSKLYGTDLCAAAFVYIS